MSRHTWGPSYDPDYRECTKCGKTVGIHWPMSQKQSECKGKAVSGEEELNAE